MVLPHKLRRSVSVIIPLLDALVLLGVIESVFKISISENLFQTGVTFGMILAVLNIFLLYLTSKHLVP